jgi:peroxiredoxin
MTLLSPGDQFPVLSPTPPGGEILALPGALAGGFGVVLFYRGSWCPYYNAQLRAFQCATAGLAEVGAKVVALSADDEATSRELIARHGLTFPVGHTADARVIAQTTGAFSTRTRCMCSRPGSSWTRPGGWWSASTPAAPSAGSSPKTS